MILYFLSWLVVGVLAGLAYQIHRVDADEYDPDFTRSDPYADE